MLYPSSRSIRMVEWGRLDQLGKLRWWGKNEKPHSLNVNPAAILLKDEKGPDGSWRVKKRIILDLLRGRVNERPGEIAPHYGTIDQAVGKMYRGSWLFVMDLLTPF